MAQIALFPLKKMKKSIIYLQVLTKYIWKAIAFFQAITFYAYFFPFQVEKVISAIQRLSLWKIRPIRLLSLPSLILIGPGPPPDPDPSWSPPPPPELDTWPPDPGGTAAMLLELSSFSLETKSKIKGRVTRTARSLISQLRTRTDVGWMIPGR